MSGEWESVDLTLCTSFTSINTVSFSIDISTDFHCDVHGLFMLLHLQANVTLDNYEEVLTSISGAVRGAAINEQIQTTSNLAIVAATFERTAALTNENTSIPNTVSSPTYYYWFQTQ